MVNGSSSAEWLASTTLNNTPMAQKTHTVVVDAIHDGDQLHLPAPIAARSDVRTAFQQLRAHGSQEFAHELHHQLQASSVVTLSLARVSLDLDELPGVDMTGRNRALGAPVAPHLSNEARRQLMQTYRLLLTKIAEARHGTKLWVSIRSTHAPILRLRCIAQPPARAGFDPFVPRDIFSCLCQPILTQAIGRTMGSSLEPMSQTRPLLPTSMAARAAVFDWIKYLQNRLEDYGPVRNEIWDTARRELWTALLDTSGLSAKTHAINSYLHHQLEVEPIEQERYQAIAERHAIAQRWIEQHSDTIVQDYQHWPQRQQGLVVELPNSSHSRNYKPWAKLLADGIQTGLWDS